LRRGIDGLTRVLAIELLTAARGIELRLPLQPAPVTAAVIAALRAAGGPPPSEDRWLAPEIDIAVDLITSGAVVAAAESVTGPLA
jgi:histidine ammonia-lyase